MRKITILGLILCILILLGVEVYALITPQEKDTISEILWEVFRDYPISGVVAGIIIGHIVWPLTKDTRR